MWLYSATDDIYLKVNTAMQRAKKAIMTDRTKLKKKLSLNAAGQYAIRADLLSEEVFINTLIHEGISGTLYSEESGVKTFGEPSEDDSYSLNILIDPLDGSHNYIKGIPFGCISVAYGKYNELPTIDDLNNALILNLYADEIFHAVKGKGAWYNGQKITPKMSNGDVQMSYYAYSKSGKQYFFDFQHKYAMRSLGSAAWEIALVASGVNDAFADIRNVLRVHDFAAAKIIVEEVGGYFTFLSEIDTIAIDDFTTGYSVLATLDPKLHMKLFSEFKIHNLVKTY